VTLTFGPKMEAEPFEFTFRRFEYDASSINAHRSISIGRDAQTSTYLVQLYGKGYDEVQFSKPRAPSFP
jgi:hypothetical protein